MAGSLCLLLALFYSTTNAKMQPSEYMEPDILSPFSKNNVDTRRKNRLSHKHFEEFNSVNNDESKYSIHPFLQKIGNDTVMGHIISVSSGIKMVSLLEPKETGGCRMHKTAKVIESAKQRECSVAISAGFYNKRTHQCFGNLISDGEQVNQFQGLKSANFGIRKDGSFVVGYLKETDIADMRHPLFQLVSGVGWILRNGDDNLKESLKSEQCNLENLEDFFKLKSARTFLGHDAFGNVKVVQVEGKTGQYGISLYGAVKLLKTFGLINAINLNGGGAANLVINQTTVNYPSNLCYSNTDGDKRLCETEVSSILCVHPPDKCVPGQSCSGNGECKKGKCQCEDGWVGNECEFNGGMLEYCCWRNYNLVVVLSALIATSVLVNIFLFDMLMLYRFRSKELAQPKRKQRDKLRTYLKENSVISSNDDESTDFLASEENLLSVS